MFPYSDLSILNGSSFSKLSTTNSYMCKLPQSAGFTETRSQPPIQNQAKAPKLRCQVEHPHFVYSLLATGRFFLSTQS